VGQTQPSILTRLERRENDLWIKEAPEATGFLLPLSSIDSVEVFRTRGGSASLVALLRGEEGQTFGVMQGKTAVHYLSFFDPEPPSPSPVENFRRLIQFLSQQGPHLDAGAQAFSKGEQPPVGSLDGGDPEDTGGAAPPGDPLLWQQMVAEASADSADPRGVRKTAGVFLLILAAVLLGGAMFAILRAQSRGQTGYIPLLGAGIGAGCVLLAIGFRYARRDD